MSRTKSPLRSPLSPSSGMSIAATTLFSHQTNSTRVSRVGSRVVRGAATLEPEKQFHPIPRPILWVASPVHLAEGRVPRVVDRHANPKAKPRKPKQTAAQDVPTRVAAPSSDRAANTRSHAAKNFSTANASPTKNARIEDAVSRAPADGRVPGETVRRKRPGGGRGGSDGVPPGARGVVLVLVRPRPGPAASRRRTSRRTLPGPRRGSRAWGCRTRFPRSGPRRAPTASWRPRQTRARPCRGWRGRRTLTRRICGLPRQGTLS